MAKYYGTHTCGHEGVTNVTGPSKNRQWIVDKHFERLCSACYEEHLVAERARINAEAEKKAKEMELPILTGSDKQVQWANTLRQNLIDEVEKKMEKIEEFKGNRDLANQIFAYMLETKTQATWYIENRLMADHLERLFRDLQSEMPADKLQEEIIKDIKEEATVYPENATTNAVVNVTIKADQIAVAFEKNEKFIEIVKALGYKWDGIWQKSINELTGSASDRAAELGNKLLNAGFPILIMDPEILNKAIKGDYAPECNRWVALRDGKLLIKWWEKNDRLYNVSRKIPSSRWDNGVIVNIAYHNHVDEFAELYGFKFTALAREAISQHVETLLNAKRVDPAPPVKDVRNKDGLKEILESEIGVLSDLMDED